ncbi:thiol reductase thioredoxin [Patescibacteria group bacterium]|nr:thiol reductase thioredoxin [Patescibacteria group bacterium]
MSRLVTEVIDDTFSNLVLNSPLPVIVDFWSPACGPCISLAPLLEKYAKKMQGKITFLKYEVKWGDDQPIRAQYDIRCLPTAILFKNGKEMKRASGIGSADTTINVLLASLARPPL